MATSYFNVAGNSIQVDYMTPRGIYICDGSEDEAHVIINKLMERGTLEKLEKLENWLGVDYPCFDDDLDVVFIHPVSDRSISGRRLMPKV